MIEEQDIIISEEHEALLKTVLQLDERRKIPKVALELYQELRVSLRRLGHSVPTEWIALVPIILNRVARPEPRTFIDEVNDHGHVKYGTRVVAKFSGKWQIGRFCSLDGGKVNVILDGDTVEERKLSATLVRMATREDLKKIEEEDNA